MRRKSVEFQNKSGERLKVKTLELWSIDQTEITEINILKKFYKKFEEQSQKFRTKLVKYTFS